MYSGKQKLYVLAESLFQEDNIMKKMRNLLTLAAAAALTGILLTGCSTEADETTIAKAETTTQTESAADAEKASDFSCSVDGSCLI